MAERVLAKNGVESVVLRGGVVGGLVAGLVFAFLEMLVASATNMAIGTPWKMFASIIMGRPAIEGALTFGVFLVGALVHFALAALFGLIWGAIVRSVSPTIRDNYGSHSIAAMLYGVVIYLINFQLIARAIYPWFTEANQLTQLLLHVLAFGLPLGLYLCARLRPIERKVERPVT